MFDIRMSPYLNSNGCVSRTGGGNEGNVNERLLELEKIINTQNEMLQEQNRIIEEQKERIEAVEKQFKH